MCWEWTPCPFTRIYVFAGPWWGSCVELFLWFRVIYFYLYLITPRGDSDKLIYSLMSEWWAISTECRRLLVQYLHYLVTASLTGTEEFLPSLERIHSSIGQLGWKYLLFFFFTLEIPSIILCSLFSVTVYWSWFFLQTMGCCTSSSTRAAVSTPKIVLNSSYIKSGSCHDSEASHLS